MFVIRGDVSLRTRTFLKSNRGGISMWTYQVTETLPPLHLLLQALRENLVGFPLFWKFDNMLIFSSSLMCDTVTPHWGLL